MRNILLATTFLIAACATTPSTHLNEGKAIASAWTALDAVSVTLDSLAKSNALPKDKALRVADDIQKAENALDSATTAYKNSDNATAQQNVTLATSLIADLISIAQSSK